LVKAFSLIELIFAIVIMGLAVSTLPRVTQSVLDSVGFSISQEAIWLSSSAIFNILDYKWDENSTIAGSLDRKVVDVSNSLNGGHSDLNRSYRTDLNPPSYNYRDGHFRADGRRKFHNSVAYASTPAQLGANSDQDDIDDFIGSGINLAMLNLGKNLDYKHSRYEANIDVYYINDKSITGIRQDGTTTTTNYSNAVEITFNLTKNPSSASTNIKFIELNVTDPQDTSRNMLRLIAFSSNIGEYFDLTNKVR